MSKKRGKVKVVLMIAAVLALLVLVFLGAGLGQQRWVAGKAMASDLHATGVI